MQISRSARQRTNVRRSPRWLQRPLPVCLARVLAEIGLQVQRACLCVPPTTCWLRPPPLLALLMTAFGQPYQHARRFNVRRSPRRLQQPRPVWHPMHALHGVQHHLQHARLNAQLGTASRAQTQLLAALLGFSQPYQHAPRFNVRRSPRQL